MTRDDVVESVHVAHVVIAPPAGSAVAIHGDTDAVVYPRSALKPLQAVAIREQLIEHGREMTSLQLATSCASHVGGDDHQVEAAAMLAEAGLDEEALRCPPAWPSDERVRSSLRAQTSLSHNCSGKHAAMLWAHTSAGDPAATYLDTDAPLQRRIAKRISEIVGDDLEGPGVDGCGAPAWRCTTGALARSFARLVAGEDDGLAAVRDAMTLHPWMVGGPEMADTAMMASDARVIAKRGAEGVLACGFLHPAHGPLGVAVKVLDGGNRAAAPLATAVCHALGAVVPTDVMRAPVLGGGRPHGVVTATSTIAAATTELFGLS